MATRPVAWLAGWFRDRPRRVTRSGRLRVEEMERRQNPAVVLGTPLNDIITVQDRGDGTVAVTVASYADAAYTTALATATQTVAAADGLTIDAGLGDDVVKIVGDTPLSAVTHIDGGAGNDRVGVFAPLARPVTFAGGAGGDVVELFGVFSAPFDPQDPLRVRPVVNNFFVADPASVSRTDNSPVSFDAATEAVLVHGSNAFDRLDVAPGVTIPITFDGGDDPNELRLEGTGGDDQFFLSDAGVCRRGDAAVFLPPPVGPLKPSYRVFVSGGAGDDTLSAAPVLAAREPGASGYFFDGGAGFDTAFVNGTDGDDVFFAVSDGLGLNGQTALYVQNTEAATTYGYGGNDTLVFDAERYGTGTLPAFGFQGGDGTDEFQLRGTLFTPDPTAFGYTLGDTVATSPTRGPFFYDGVEARQVVKIVFDNNAGGFHLEPA